jgi:poly(hydroxyalkanoate) granule-associated protein
MRRLVHHKKQEGNTMETQKDIRKFVKESAEKCFLAGLGAISIASEKGSRIVDDLIKKGRDFEFKGKDGFENTQDRMKELKKMAESYGKTFESAMDEKLKKVINKIGIPTREDISNLTKRVEILMANVEGILSKHRKKSGPTGKPPSGDISGS